MKVMKRARQALFCSDASRRFVLVWCLPTAAQAQQKAEKERGIRPPLREVARSSGLSEAGFAAVMQAGMEARQKLVVCNLALVVSLSNKYKRNNFGCSCLQVKKASIRVSS